MRIIIALLLFMSLFLVGCGGSDTIIMKKTTENYNVTNTTQTINQFDQELNTTSQVNFTKAMISGLNITSNSTHIILTTNGGKHICIGNCSS